MQSRDNYGDHEAAMIPKYDPECHIGKNFKTSMPNLEVLSQNSPRESLKNHEKTHSSVTWNEIRADW
jgi:hypothetical protein